MKDQPAKEDRYKAPALEKGLDILELLAEYGGNLSQGDIARSLDRSPNEIYRMLTTLVRRRFVTKSISDDRYALSLRMFSLSQRHPPVGRLIDTAIPLMRVLTRTAWQSCHLAMENNGDIAIVASVESPGNWGISLKVGSVIGLANTGSGRVLAAFRSEDEVKTMLERHQSAQGEPKLVEKTFFNRLDDIRKNGFEIMPSETTVGVTNITYPVFNPHGQAVTVVSCPYIKRLDEIPVPSMAAVQQLYKELADELTIQYGGTLK
ncbi:MAG: IclR family transcriptional regulator [Rhizobiales bacterium]|nr:IclR family transcriptional regulator [Hyphomicrobiales bacterium]